MMEINKIYNEDCTDFVKKLDNKSVDIVLTSPPYNMTDRKGGNGDSGRYDVYVDWKTEGEYLSFTDGLFSEFDRVVKDNGIVLYNFSYSIENPSLPYKLVSDIIANTNWNLVDTIIWKKKNGLPFPANERRLSRIWEYVFVFARKNEMDTFTINRKLAKVSAKTNQKYYQVVYNYIEAKNNDGETNDLNQATYSTDLCTQLLSIYGKEGYLVYDPFMGTGTTAVACKMLGMDYIGTELSKNQCEYAEKRLYNLFKFF